MKKTSVILLLFMMVFTCAACSSPPTEGTGSAGDKGESSQKVYTSVYPVFYFADRISQGGIDVELLMPPSADPHNWEPSPKQMAKLESCVLFIYNGAGLEPWASKVGNIAQSSGTAVFEVASALSGQLLEASENTQGESGHHHHDDYDPHFWLDPVLAKEMAAGICDALIQADPANQDLYKQNYSHLAKDLDDLHNEYKATLANCSKKEFVVSHQAFGYLANRYNLEQIPIMGIAAESEPTPTRLAELSQLIIDLNIGYVFSEPFASSQAAQALASETGVKILELNPIGGLTEQEIAAGADYISLMKNNLEQLKVALEYEQGSDN